MKYLLDTHVMLWITIDDPRLSPSVKSLYLNEENNFLLSIASIWEMAIKISIGKLSIPGTLPRFISDYILDAGIGILGIAPEHVYPIEVLPFHHRDPFDRLIIAQSMVENLPIISSDSRFDRYPIHRTW